MALAPVDEACEPRPVAAPPAEDEEVASQALALGESALKLAETDPEAAIPRYQQALVMFRKAKDLDSEAVTLANIGVELRRLARYPEALEYLNQALAAYRRLGGCKEIAQALNNRGVCLGAMGREPEALSDLRAAASVRRRTNDQKGLAHTLTSIANAARRRLSYDEALAAIDEGLDLPEGGAEGRAGLLNIQALIFEDQGKRSRAVAALREARNLFVSSEELRIEDPQQQLEGVRVTSLQLGNLALDGNDPALAVSEFKAALRASRLPSDRAETEMSIAFSEARSGKLEEGIKTARKAVAALSELGDARTLSSAYGNFGLLLLDGKDRVGARKLFLQALEKSDSFADADASDSLASRATALQALAEMDEQDGHPDVAISYYEAAIEARDRIRSGVALDDLRMGFADRSANLYERLILLLMQQNRKEEAFRYAELARSRTFVESMLGKHSDVPTTADNSGLLRQEREQRTELSSLEAELDSQRHGRAPAAVINLLAARLSSKREDYERTLARLKISGEAPAAFLGRLEPPTDSAIRAKLQPKQMLLSYFVTEQKTVAFVLKSDSFEAVLLDVGRQAIEDATTRLRDFNATTFPSTESLTLYDMLVRPLVRFGVRDAHEIGVAPHGPLHYLPFAALSDGSQYLGKRAPLFYLPSASLFGLAGSEGAARTTPMAAFAHSRAGQARLEYAADEAEDIATLYGVKALTGAAATATAFRAATPSAFRLHLAVHGLLDRVQPAFSRLLLAPDERSDGIVNLYEVPGLPLSGVDLVTLSACDTQVGHLSPGDEVAGLNRAFLAAGARTVVASLWTVDDEVGSILMKRFYQNLKAGLSKAEALKAAQTTIRADHPSPYYWASFVLDGDPGSKK
jgi:CHAT domain-containing protein/tetratricopeptide (TPR) repeat protein